MARMLGRYLTGGCWTGPEGDWRRCVPPGPDCSGHERDTRRRKRQEAREVQAEVTEAIVEFPRVVIDLNVRIGTDLTYAGFEDITGAAPDEMPRGTPVEVCEVESGIGGPAEVAGRDFERRLIYLKVDWAALK